MGFFFRKILNTLLLATILFIGGIFLLPNSLLADNLDLSNALVESCITPIFAPTTVLVCAVEPPPQPLLPNLPIVNENPIFTYPINSLFIRIIPVNVFSPFGEVIGIKLVDLTRIFIVHNVFAPRCSTTLCTPGAILNGKVTLVFGGPRIGQQEQIADFEDAPPEPAVGDYWVLGEGNWKWVSQIIITAQIKNSESNPQPPASYTLQNLFLDGKVSDPTVLHVRSSIDGQASTGVNITRISGTFGTGGTTPYDFSIPPHQVWATLGAPPTFQGSNFSQWTGCDSTSGNDCNVSIPPGWSKTITAEYTTHGLSYVDIKANGSDGPITIPSGSTALLSWTSQNVTSCSATGGAWSGFKPNSGTERVGPLTSSTSYELTCFKPEGGGGSGTEIVRDSVTINVSLPSPEPFIDCGLRIKHSDGSVLSFACEKGPLASALRFFNGASIMGIVLVDTSDSNASPVRIKTSSGVRALRSFTP